MCHLVNTLENCDLFSLPLPKIEISLNMPIFRLIESAEGLWTLGSGIVARLERAVEATLAPIERLFGATWIYIQHTRQKKVSNRAYMRVGGGFAL